MTECLLRRASRRASRRGLVAAAMDDFFKRALETTTGRRRRDGVRGASADARGEMGAAQAQFKARWLRETPKASARRLRRSAAAAGKDPNAVTHQHDEHAMVSLANAAYYRAVKTQNSSKFKSGDQASRQMEKEHLEHAQTMYTKALQKSRVESLCCQRPRHPPR